MVGTRQQPALRVFHHGGGARERVEGGLRAGRMRTETRLARPARDDQATATQPQTTGTVAKDHPPALGRHAFLVREHLHQRAVRIQPAHGCLAGHPQIVAIGQQGAARRQHRAIGGAQRQWLHLPTGDRGRRQRQQRVVAHHRHTVAVGGDHVAGIGTDPLAVVVHLLEALADADEHAVGGGHPQPPGPVQGQCTGVAGIEALLGTDRDEAIALEAVQRGFGGHPDRAVAVFEDAVDRHPLQAIGLVVFAKAEGLRMRCTCGAQQGKHQHAERPQPRPSPQRTAAREQQGEQGRQRGHRFPSTEEGQ